MPSDRLTESLLMFWRELHLLSNPVEQGEITAQQYWLLRHLNLRGRSSIGELAAALGISQSSTTTACKRLERDGLVRRERCAEDERIVRVSLTAAGKARVEQWRDRRRQMLARFLEPLAQTERDELQRVIDHVLEAAGVSSPRHPVDG